jgi:hypothetical protein
MRHLAHHWRLTSLDISNCPLITNAGLQQLEGMQPFCIRALPAEGSVSVPACTVTTCTCFTDQELKMITSDPAQG